MQIQQIALDKLVPAKAPVRHTNGGGIDALESSIESVGLLQNLGVVQFAEKGAKKYQVIFGNHRLQAMRNLVKRKAKGWTGATTVGCVVAKDKQALEAAIAENVVREPLHIVDEWEAFAALAAEGMAEKDIAAKFGWSDRKTRQVVAMGRLHKDIRALVRTGKMSIDTAQAYANAGDPTAQKKLFDSLKGQAKNGWSVRQALANIRIPVAHALFDQAKAKLATEAELFPERGDEGKPVAHFLDSDKFWARQNDAIAGLEGEMQKAGWGKVTVKRGAGAYDLPAGVRMSDKSLAKAKRADGGVQINVGKDGRVTPQYWLSEKAALATSKAKAKQEREALEEIGEAPAKPGVDRSYPRNVLADLYVQKSFMVQEALGQSPKAALVFAIWQMVREDSFKVPLQLVGHASRRALEGSAAPIAQKLCAELDLPFQLGLRQFVPDQAHALESYDPYGQVMVDLQDYDTDEDLSHRLVEGLLTLHIDALLRIFAAVLARAVGYHQPDAHTNPATIDKPIDVLASSLLVAPRQWWTPTQGFFESLPRKTLLAIAGEVFDPEGRDGVVKTLRPMKVPELAKAIIERWHSDLVSPEERARRDAWVPPALAVPVNAGLADSAGDSPSREASEPEAQAAQ